MSLLNPYVDIQVAIITQALEDYEEAVYYNNLRTQSEVTRFFRSDWGDYLSNGLGSKGLKRVKEETEHLKKFEKRRRGRYIITNIKATKKRQAMLKENMIRFKVDPDGCFIFGIFYSFKRGVNCLTSSGVL